MDVAWRATLRASGGTSSRARPHSHVEKYRLVVALQADVETIDRVAVARLALRDQRSAALGRHQGEHGVGGVGSLAAEINPCVEMHQHAAPEHRKQDMRCL